MGEFADEAIDRLLSDEGTYWADDRTITCKRCGADDLYWEEARGERNEKRWVLVGYNGTVHACPDAPSAASADEFDTVEPHEPVPHNSQVRTRTPTHEPRTKGGAKGTARDLRAERVPPVDSVPRKHDVSRKPRARRK